MSIFLHLLPIVVGGIQQGISLLFQFITRRHGFSWGLASAAKMSAASLMSSFECMP